MAGMRISDLTTASAVADSDLLEVAKVDGNSSSGYMSYKETMSAIAIYITKLATYSNDLNTTDKHIIGAINELKQLVSLIPQFAIEVVAQLPTQDISETTIYLVPNSDPEQGNYYEEYIYVNNAWELVGSTEVDLSDYYTKSQVDGMFNGLATVATSGSYTDLSNKPTIDSALSTSSTNAVQNQVITNKINGLMDVTETLDTTPYVYRQTPSGQYTVKEQLIGGSVVWNQLVDTNTESVTVPSGHTYILWNGSALSLATSDGTAVSVSSGYKFYDITQMFGTAVANQMTTTKFASLFPNYASYAYSASTIQSVNVASKVVRDSNNQVVSTYQFDDTLTLRGMYELYNNTLRADGDIYNSDGTVERQYVESTYKSGDETQKNGLTDGTNSIYKVYNYGFYISGSESNPSDKITYIADSVGMTPAHMDYTNDVFDYGSWENAFFMPRPCMLKSDGTVDYYLDPDDYTKKLDGTASDVANDQYDGNAMMEWGRGNQKIWYKIVPDNSDVTSASIYISNYKIDNGYVDWSFHNFQGVSGNHFYTPIYNGSLDANNKLRSISGKQVMASKTATNEVTYAENNNPANTPIWNIEQYCDIVLITLLLWLMGKSTNTQDVFGNGISTGSQAGCEAYRTGSLNNKGMFYGKDGSVNTTTAVKVFGMENFWGLQWRRYQGHLLISGSQYVKMTYGQEDGSTADGFSLDGTGYINKGHQPTGTSGHYLKTQEYDSMGFYPKNANNTDASATKYYCDGLLFNNSGTRVPFRGGSSNYGAVVGASAVILSNAASNAGWNFGASLSCKP